MGIELTDVRIPPRGLQLNVGMAERLVKAAWYSSLAQPPDKIVILSDTDISDSTTVIQEFESELPRRLVGVKVEVLYAYAQQHLEAWYFGDPQRLRKFLQRDLGRVDPSTPDDIQNPKHHLKNLLGDRIYTARVSEQIAKSLDFKTIQERSPSFRGFVEAVQNGGTVTS